MDTGNHYVAQVKRNQPSLYTEIERYLLERLPIATCEMHEKGHGRHTSWYCAVYNARESKKCEEWKNLQRFIHIKKFIYDTKNKSSTESDRVYISDLFTTCSASYQQGIRGHWSIENLLHREKDVLHNEDGNGIKIQNGPVNMSIISSFAINIHRIENSNISLTDAQVKTRANIHEIICRIRT